MSASTAATSRTGAVPVLVVTGSAGDDFFAYRVKVHDNTFNRANSGTPTRWSGNTGFPLGGGSQDPGPGVVVNGVLPPTFSGNTLWHTDVTATDHHAPTLKGNVKDPLAGAVG